MGLYVIGDLHLSIGTNKPMDVFGGRWEDYLTKLKSGFSVLKPEDCIVLCGDLSWGMSLDETLKDFLFVEEFPGRKIVLKGNHDYWWNTAAKIKRFFEDRGIQSISLLHNNCHYYRDVAICGTRGWFYEEETHSAFDRKILNRELMRLEASFQSAGTSEKYCFLHYPPRYKDYVCWEIVSLMEKYQIKKCFYGHIHGNGHRYAVQGVVDGIDYRLVSSDYLNFHPLKAAD